MVKMILPLGIGLSINFFVVVTARFSLTSFGASIAVNSKLESFAMNILRKRSDSRWESFLIYNYGSSIVVSVRLPTIIKIQVVVTKLIKAKRADFICSFLDNSLIDVAKVVISTVPSHLRRLTQTIVDSLRKTKKS
jgi:hypothetical protein